MPKVAVIIPLYNAAPFIRETLESVLGQSASDIEVVIVDDGSTDQGPAIVQEYQEKTTRVRLIHQKNSGPAQARNRGILATDSEYLAFLDSDDLWLPQKLERQLAFLEEHPEVALCYTDARVIDSEGRPLPHRERKFPLPVFHDPQEALEHLMLINFVVTSSVVLRRQILKESGLFSDRYLGAEDWDLWLRIARKGLISGIREPLCLYRYHEQGLSRRRSFLLLATYRLTERSLQWLSPDGPPQLKNKLRRRLALLASEIGKYYPGRQGLNWHLKAIRHLPHYPTVWLRLLRFLVRFGQQ